MSGTVYILWNAIYFFYIVNQLCNYVYKSKYRVYLSNSVVIMLKIRSILSVYCCIMCNSHDILPKWHAILCMYRLILSEKKTWYHVQFTWYLVKLSCYLGKYRIILSSNGVTMSKNRSILTAHHAFMSNLHDISSICHAILCKYGAIFSDSCVAMSNRRSVSLFLMSSSHYILSWFFLKWSDP